MTSTTSFDTMRQGRQTGSRRRHAVPTPPVMAYATYIGRVGAVAVALGVGVAVATGCGVAWAEPSGASSSGSSSSSSTSSSSAPKGSTGSSPSTSGQVSGSSAANSTAASKPLRQRRTGAVTRRTNPAVDAAAQSPSSATGLNKANTVASDTAQQRDLLVAGTASEPTSTPPANGTSTPPATDVLTTVQQDVAPQAPGLNQAIAALAPPGTAPTASAATPTTAETPETPGADVTTSRLAKRSKDWPTAPTSGSTPTTDAVQSTTSTRLALEATVLDTVAPPSAAIAQPSTSVPAAPAESASMSSSAMSTNTVAPQAVPALFSGPLAPLNVITGVVSSVLGAIVSPLATNTPLAPAAPSPTLLGLLELVRREIEATLAPSTENIAVNAVPQTELPVGFQRTLLVSGLNQPTDFRFLPHGRILIAEESGAIMLYNNKTGQLQSQPLIMLPNARGLDGMEVDPNFKKNGYIYVSYVTADNYERLSRLTVTNPKSAALTADPASEFVLMQGNQPAADDHLGGAIRFGPDGKLYWSVGNNDFYASNPPGYHISNNAQDLSNMYGKVLRLNPDGTVPADNPFVNTTGADPYIYAYGFRNPFRMTFTPDGQLLVGDVGESTWEELDNVTAGGNYGWPLAEGPCNGIGTTSCSTPSSYVNPIYAYPHNGANASITSVLVYTGSKFGKSYRNTVFIADYSQGWIQQLTCTSGYSSCGSARMFDPGTQLFNGPVELLEGPDGNIYELQNSSGELSRIAPSRHGLPVAQV